MEKNAQNCHPHRGIKKNIVFHFVFALGASLGRFRGPAGVRKFQVFVEKLGPESLFVFLVILCRVVCSLKWPLEAPGRPQGGPREAPASTQRAPGRAQKTLGGPRQATGQKA